MMRKFTKEISALLASVTVGAAVCGGASTVSSEEAERVAGVASISDEAAENHEMEYLVGEAMPEDNTEDLVFTAGVPMLPDETIPPADGMMMPEIPTDEEIPPLAGDIAPADGDINGDGKLGRNDVVTMQKWLSKSSDARINYSWAVDMNYDGKINVIDSIIMKRKLSDEWSKLEVTVTCEGEKIGASAEKGWYSTSYTKELTTEELKKNPEIAELLGRIIDKRDKLKNVPMLSWNTGIEDYGQDNLCINYTGYNGDPMKLTLCKVGEECAWLDDSDVQLLVILLADNNLYSEKIWIDSYIDSLKTE